MKKIIASTLVGVLSLSSMSSVFAGGFDMYPSGGSSSELQFAIDSIKDQSVKDIITKNLLTITSNSIVEDYDYNSKHFFTKKFKSNIVIPEDLKTKVQKAYIAFSANEGGPVMYDVKMAATPSTTDAGNHVLVNIDLSKATEEITLNIKDFEKYVTNDFGTSFVGVAYIELEGGIKIPFSNVAYLYLQKNNNEGKKSHLMNLYYQSTQYSGMANTQELLQKVFEKIMKKTGSVAKYIAVLEAAMTKVDEKIKKVEATQNAAVEGINTEEDFVGKVTSYGLSIERLNLLNDIKYQLGTEVKTKQSQDVIEEIFGSESN